MPENANMDDVAYSQKSFLYGYICGAGIGLLSASAANWIFANGPNIYIAGLLIAGIAVFTYGAWNANKMQSPEDWFGDTDV